MQLFKRYHVYVFQRCNISVYDLIVFTSIQYDNAINETFFIWSSL